MQLMAKIEGKVVGYPIAATFIIERRKNNGKYALLGERSNINSALTKYHNSKQDNHITRLSAVEDGRIYPLAKG